MNRYHGNDRSAALALLLAILFAGAPAARAADVRSQPMVGAYVCYFYGPADSYPAKHRKCKVNVPIPAHASGVFYAQVAGGAGGHGGGLGNGFGGGPGALTPLLELPVASGSDLAVIVGEAGKTGSDMIRASDPSARNNDDQIRPKERYLGGPGGDGGRGYNGGGGGGGGGGSGVGWAFEEFDAAGGGGGGGGSSAIRVKGKAILCAGGGGGTAGGMVMTSPELTAHGIETGGSGGGGGGGGCNFSSSLQLGGKGGARKGGDGADAAGAGGGKGGQGGGSDRGGRGGAGGKDFGGDGADGFFLLIREELKKNRDDVLRIGAQNERALQREQGKSAPDLLAKPAYKAEEIPGTDGLYAIRAHQGKSFSINSQSFGWAIIYVPQH